VSCNLDTSRRHGTSVQTLTLSVTLVLSILNEGANLFVLGLR
jgi:hypothetical protein